MKTERNPLVNYKFKPNEHLNNKTQHKTQTAFVFMFTKTFQSVSAHINPNMRGAKKGEK